MKQKHFKIKETTLFVYRPQKNLTNSTETTTDPTTSMVTLTKTGILQNDGLK